MKDSAPATQSPPSHTGPQAPAAQLRQAARRAARATRIRVALVALLLLAVIASSLAVTITLERHHGEEMALTTARSIADAVVAMRLWTAQQNGVYVPVSEAVPPNPYLHVPDRDITDDRGRHLTKVNPAYLTRLVAARLPGEMAMNIRVTSRSPLRPANRAQGWEEEALARIAAAGGRIDETSSLAAATPTGPRFRYMRALWTRKPCLRCHGRQGYQEGDLRGGLAITFAYQPFQEVIQEHERHLLLGHAVIALLCLAAVAFLGNQLLRQTRQLEEESQHIRVLEGLLPICAGCKKIRRQGGRQEDPSAWVSLERYLSDHSHARFSHGLCPECLERLYAAAPAHPPPERPSS